MVATYKSDEVGGADSIVVKAQTWKAVQEVRMCEKCVAAVEDLAGFFVDFAADGQDLRVEWWIAVDTRSGEGRDDGQLFVDLVSDLAWQRKESDGAHYSCSNSL